MKEKLHLNATEAELRAVLVDELGITDSQGFERARAVASRLGIPLEQAVVERERITFVDLLRRLADHWGVGWIDLRISDVDPEALRAVDPALAREQVLVPFALQGNELHVAMWDPRNTGIVRTMAQRTGHRIKPFLAPPAAIQSAQLLYRENILELLEHSAREDDVAVPEQALARDGEHPSVVQLLERLIEYAIVARASDVHIDPFDRETIVHCRIDGILHDVLRLSRDRSRALLARIKVLGGMRIDEHRAPQDGHFVTQAGELDVDVRISTFPTVWGERAVLRILSRAQAPLDLDSLGLADTDREIVLEQLARPYGLVLVSGPTGSGKTTSLYAMLSRLAAEREHIVSISTIEDPVEYTFPRMTQTQVNPAAGIEFATGLRSVLRQDPDVLMVGEIRDAETMSAAIRGALIGRLLFSTVHANDSTAVVTRLLDMGAEPFLLASTLNIVIAQRLVRQICPSCREEHTIDRFLQAEIDRRRSREGAENDAADGETSARFFQGSGCDRCRHTGFLGRTGIFELLRIDAEMREQILARSDAKRLRRTAIEQGMKTIFADGLAKAQAGVATIEDVIRATG